MDPQLNLRFGCFKHHLAVVQSDINIHRQLGIAPDSMKQLSNPKRWLFLEGFLEKSNFLAFWSESFLKEFFHRNKWRGSPSMKTRGGLET